MRRESVNLITRMGHPGKATAAAWLRGQWRRRVVAVAAGTVLVGALTAGAPAAAASAAQNVPSSNLVLTVVYGSSGTNANLWKGVDLRCGGHFLGGGGWVQGPASQNVGVSQAAPGSRGGAVLDDPHAMRVSATAAPQTTPANWTLHAYGICAFGLSGVEYQREYVSASTAGRGPLTSIARCSPGKSLVGMGGQSFAVPQNVRLSTLAPGNNLVIARVTPQPDPANSWAVQAIAVCANNGAAGITSGHSGTADGSTSAMSASAQCPSGQYPTGAGFGHGGEAGNLVQSLLIPMSDRIAGTTRTDTRVAVGSWNTATYALCLPAVLV